MIKVEFKQQLEKYADIVNEYLDRCIVQNELPEKSLYSAMRYSLMAGGKRLRPVLSLAVCDMLEEVLNKCFPLRAPLR